MDFIQGSQTLQAILLSPSLLSSSSSSPSIIQDTVILVQSTLSSDATFSSTKVEEHRSCLEFALRSALDHLVRQERAQPQEQEQQMYRLIEVSFSLFDASLLEASSVAILLNDMADALTIDRLGDYLSFIESHHSHLSLASFTAQKLKFIALCCKLLRRLSKTNHTLLCGRLLVLLSYIVPLHDESGLNKLGRYNVANVTELIEDAISGGSGSEPSASSSQEDKLIGVDSEFYRLFWGIQKFCYNSELWKQTPSSALTTFLDSVQLVLEKTLEPYSLRDAQFVAETKETKRMFSSMQQGGGAGGKNAKIDVNKKRKVETSSSSSSSSKPAASSSSSSSSSSAPPGELIDLISPEEVKDEQLMRDLGDDADENRHDEEMDQEMESDLQSSQQPDQQQQKMQAEEEALDHLFFVPKYLTSKSLMTLQLSDPLFRRNILVQLMLVFTNLEMIGKTSIPASSAAAAAPAALGAPSAPSAQSVSSAESASSSSSTPSALLSSYYTSLNTKDKEKKVFHLSSAETQRISSLLKRLYTCLEKTPPNGKHFARSISRILERETFWTYWKVVEKCADFQQKGKSAGGDDENKKWRLQAGRSLSSRYVSAFGFNPFKQPPPPVSLTTAAEKYLRMGHQELASLWESSALLSSSPSPSSENSMCFTLETPIQLMHLMEQNIEKVKDDANPDEGIDEEFKNKNIPLFVWRTLRLLTRQRITVACGPQQPSARPAAAAAAASLGGKPTFDLERFLVPTPSQVPANVPVPLAPVPTAAVENGINSPSEPAPVTTPLTGVTPILSVGGIIESPPVDADLIVEVASSSDDAEKPSPPPLAAEKKEEDVEMGVLNGEEPVKMEEEEGDEKFESPRSDDHGMTPVKREDESGDEKEEGEASASSTVGQLVDKA